MIPQNCRRKKLGDEVTENWHKVEDTENELDCDSSDQLYLFSVFTVRSFKLYVNKHLHYFLQMYDDIFNLLGIQSQGGVHQKIFIISEVAHWIKVPQAHFPSQNRTPLQLVLISFLTVIWLSHGQLWAIRKRTASLTRC